ncbi:nucleotidyltransferase domain-containing protein [Natronococcus sp. A-GB1]|uniref:nucleotidyltransferase domain-containing protein n=1 Tax=Natrialbaceae TaxID=1644061 RepID=UPI0013ED61BB|nr:MULTISPECIES: nucleotidyltransferase domain-containing protein [Natrialbaceae]MDG5761911.1 nucleotidyltransferase domain-containing protein [Natronococcus sp. A-GB1]NGM69221.1 nucleotidyltransferase domain-containing protein [Natronolimnobius sp. AArcel1]
MQEQMRVLLDFPFPEERVFRYQAMQDILHHLVNNPFEEFTQKELATITDSDISSVSRAVELLEQMGVLDIANGKPAQIRIDQDHITGSNPLFTIPQREFRKPVQAFLNELAKDVEASDDVDEVVGIILFGSVARGQADRSSDIDLLVIVKGNLTYGRRLASQLVRDLEERTFHGERYQFEVLVETPESAASHGEKLREIFDEGLVLERIGALEDVRKAAYETERGGE